MQDIKKCIPQGTPENYFSYFIVNIEYTENYAALWPPGKHAFIAVSLYLVWEMIYFFHFKINCSHI